MYNGAVSAGQYASYGAPAGVLNDPLEYQSQYHTYTNRPTVLMTHENEGRRLSLCWTNIYGFVSPFRHDGV